MLRVVVTVIALLSLSGCESTRLSQCASGLTSMISETLYFGTVYPGGTITSDEWQGFLAAVVTPRFPTGFSVWSGTGQWSASDGGVVKENSYILNIVHQGEGSDEAAFQEIVTEYKQEFQQESVLRVQGNVCVAF